MCEEWMSPVKLDITIEQFHQLPRHPAFKYEYFGGHAYLTPRPKFYHALLELDQFQPPEATREFSVRLYDDTEFTILRRSD